MKKIAFFLFILFIGCITNDNENGLNSLILTSPELAGINCSTGGLKIETGLDNNSNGSLDSDEVLTTNYICSGFNSLINIIDELKGTICEKGGIRIETGIDLNGNGALDTEEILITRFLCNNDNGNYDEQIRLNFGLKLSGSASVSSSGNLVGEIPNFNKNFWRGVDSIVFVAKLSAFNNTSNTNPNNMTFAEVFDSTNNSVIENSLISTNEQNYDSGLMNPFLHSENIFEFLPNEEITLSILLKSETDGDGVFIYNPAYLFLYRSN